MATRFYFNNSGAQTGLAALVDDASWTQVASNFFRGKLGLAKGANGSVAATGSTNTNSQFFWVGGQHVSIPVTAAGTITGDVTVAMLGVESNAALNAHLNAVVYVLRADGTTRATLATGQGALGSEFGTSASSRVLTMTVSSTAIAVGDRIVVEVGWRTSRSGGGGTSYSGTITFLDTGTDFTTAGGQASGCPWVEFTSNDIIFTVFNDGAATLVGDGSITATPTLFKNGASSLAGDATISADATVTGAPVTHDGTATLTGEATLSAAATSGRTILLAIPLREGDEGTYEQEINPNTEGLASAGYYIQPAVGLDQNVGIERDASDNLILKDPVTGSKTLAELLGGGGGMTELQHGALRQITHFIEEGPAEGFATNAYKEVLPAADPFPTSIIWWESSAKTQKIVERTLTYNANMTIATDEWKVYADDGVTLENTVTDTYAYSGIFETSRTRTIL